MALAKFSKEEMVRSILFTEAFLKESFFV